MKRKLELYIRTAIARGYVRVRGQMRDINWIISSVIGAFLTMATFVYLYKSINAPAEFSSLVLLGGFMTPYWFNVLWSVASQLYWEKEMGNLEIIIFSPAPLSAFLLGLTIGGFIHTSLRSFMVLLVGILVFRIQFMLFNLPAVIFVFLVSLTALYAVGMIFSSLFLFYGRELWRIGVLVQEPVTIASGFYFPIKFLGILGASIVSLIPLALGLDALRQLLIKGYKVYFLPWKLEVLLLIGMSVLFMFIAIKMLSFVELLAKREGRLTLKWQ